MAEGDSWREGPRVLNYVSAATAAAVLSAAAALAADALAADALAAAALAAATSAPAAAAMVTVTTVVLKCICMGVTRRKPAAWHRQGRQKHNKTKLATTNPNFR